MTVPVRREAIETAHPKWCISDATGKSVYVKPRWVLTRSPRSSSPTFFNLRISLILRGIWTGEQHASHGTGTCLKPSFGPNTGGSPSLRSTNSECGFKTGTPNDVAILGITASRGIKVFFVLPPPSPPPPPVYTPHLVLHNNNKKTREITPCRSSHTPPHVRLFGPATRHALCAPPGTASVVLSPERAEGKGKKKTCVTVDTNELSSVSRQRCRDNATPIWNVGSP